MSMVRVDLPEPPLTYLQGDSTGWLVLLRWDEHVAFFAEEELAITYCVDVGGEAVYRGSPRELICGWGSAVVDIGTGNFVAFFPGVELDPSTTILSGFTIPAGWRVVPDVIVRGHPNQNGALHHAT